MIRRLLSLFLPALFVLVTLTLVGLLINGQVNGNHTAQAASSDLGACCPDCTAAKRFIDAICDEASGIPPVKSVCDKYHSGD